uniref:Deneddylase UL36 n=1 Tax=Lygus hesperus TaxID=30085 RepID=A0A0A9Z929_LYGHE
MRCATQATIEDNNNDNDGGSSNVSIGVTEYNGSSSDSVSARQQGYEEKSTQSSAPLQFVPSPLAAGGYVMTAVSDEDHNTNNCKQELSGKPSSTLLIQFCNYSPLP